jgi:hypothetical protein
MDKQHRPHRKGIGASPARSLFYSASAQNHQLRD